MIRALLIAAAVTFASVGVAKCQGDRAVKAERDRNAWRAAATAAKISLNASELRRRDEQRRAVAAVSEEQGSCDAKIAAARSSARTIRQIVTREVPRDPQGCPVRGIVRGPDGLRDALQPR